MFIYGLQEHLTEGGKIQNEAVVPLETLKEKEAYRNGWQDGRFGPSGSFSGNQSLAGWSDLDRLAYYRGHRDGGRVRAMLHEDAAGF